MTLAPETALAGLDDFTIEVPSWAYGNSGTRFKVFSTPGAPNTLNLVPELPYAQLGTSIVKSSSPVRSIALSFVEETVIGCRRSGGW